jgi:hypothetical protein
MVSPDAPISDVSRVRVVADDAGEAARHEAAAALRKQRPGWVVIWLARKGEFRARPLFRVPPNTVAIGANTEELTAQMDEIQQAAGRPDASAHP